MRLTQTRERLPREDELPIFQQIRRIEVADIQRFDGREISDRAKFGFGSGSDGDDGIFDTHGGKKRLGVFCLRGVSERLEDFDLRVRGFVGE